MLAGPALAQAPKLEKTRIALSVGGSISQMNKVAYFVALNRKYFDQEGLTVNSTPFASGSAALQNLIGGNADVVEGAFEQRCACRPRDQSDCLVAYGRYAGNVLVVKKSEADKIKSVAGLKGKKIGMSSPGSATHNFVASAVGARRRALAGGKLCVDRNGPERGRGDAYRRRTRCDRQSRSGHQRADRWRDAVVLVDCPHREGTVAAFGGAYLADCLYVKTEFLKANPNTSQAIANAIVHAMQWLKTASIDEIIKSLPPDYYRANEKLYRKSLEKNLAAFQWDGIVTTEAVKNVWDSIAVLEPEFRQAKVDFEKTYDNTLIERALAKYSAPLKE